MKNKETRCTSLYIVRKSDPSANHMDSIDIARKTVAGKTCKTGEAWGEMGRVKNVNEFGYGLDSQISLC